MLKALHQIWILAWKDIVIDLRRKENVLSMLFFSVLTLLIFQFALGENPQAFRFLVPGLIWVVFLLAGVLGLGKAFAQEHENGCMSGLLLTPIDRGLLFLGKMLGTTLFLCLVEFLTIPLFLIFFNITPLYSSGWLVLLVLAGTLGFSSLGTLLAAMTATLRGREVLLPLLLFPLMIPHLLSLIRITSFLFFGGEWNEILPWIKLLAAFDVVLGVIAYLSFEFVLEE